MPDGVVQWFDPNRGEGRILHAGSKYVVHGRDMDSKARTPGARVQFDVDHDADGSVATRVRLLPGTRVSHHQRRFGDLSGATRPDTKGNTPFTRERPDLGPTLQRNPVALAEQWADWMENDDLEQAMQLYAPDASLHVGDDVLVGHHAIRGYWQGSSFLGGTEPAHVEGDGRNGVRLRWEAEQPDGTSEIALRTVHGEITEQWIGRSWPEEDEAEAEELLVNVSVDGDLSERAQDYALDKVRKVLGTISDPVLYAELRLERAGEPAGARPIVARATIDLNGALVLARVAGHDPNETADLLEQRLRQRLRVVEGHRAVLRDRGPTSPPGEWRHGDLPTDRPPYHPRPVEEREIVRHQSYSPPTATIDEAIFDLEAMDDEFCLFTDVDTGDDAVVHRLEGGGYGLRYRGDGPAGVTATAAAVEVDPDPTPTLSLDEAREHLDLGYQPWVFHRDPDHERGQVLYRRYDGHYGLVTPRTDEDGG